MDNLTSIVQVNGKKLKPGHLKLLASLENKFGVKLSASKAERQNPYSGVRCELEPLAVTIHDFIIDNYRRNNVGCKGGVPVSLWDRARYFFLEYWPEQYYNLID